MSAGTKSSNFVDEILFSVSQHVDNLLAACAQTLFALRILRHHGLPDDAIHVVFQAAVAGKRSYASPACMVGVFKCVGSRPLRNIPLSSCKAQFSSGVSPDT